MAGSNDEDQQDQTRTLSEQDQQERERLLQQRDNASHALDDENMTDEEREEQQRYIDSLDDEMRRRGYPEYSQEEQDERERQYLEGQRSQWEQYRDDPYTDEAGRQEAEQNITAINDRMAQRGLLNQNEEDQNSTGDGENNSEGTPTQTPPETPPAVSNNGKPPLRKAGVGKFALRGAKTLGKGALKAGGFAGKGLLRAVGAIGGATVGLAAGLTTGDMSKTFTYAAAGAVTGNLIGKNAGNMAGRAARGVMDLPKQGQRAMNAVDNIVDTWNRDTRGEQYARDQRIDRQNQESRRRLLKNEDQIEKAQEWIAKNARPEDNIDVNDVLNAKADLYEAGITDEKFMDDVMKTEFKNTGSLSGSDHQQYVDTAGFIKKNNYSEDNIADEDKLRRMEQRVQRMVSGDDAQLRVMQMTSQMLGADDLYEASRRQGRTLIGRPQNTRGSNQQTNNQQNGGSGGGSQQRTTRPRNNPPSGDSGVENSPSPRRGRPPRNNPPSGGSGGSQPRTPGPRNNPPSGGSGGSQPRTPGPRNNPPSGNSSTGNSTRSRRGRPSRNNSTTPTNPTNE